MGAEMLKHPHETERLESLRSYRITGTDPEPEFDAIATLAAAITNSPIAVVAFVGEQRQWFKSLVGLDIPTTTRAQTFCSHVTATGDSLIVGDATRDPRFAGMDMVCGMAGLRAYAGTPLVGRDGLPLGTLCVLDRRPRRYTARQMEMLERLAGQVMSILELRRGDAARGLSWESLTADLTDPARIWQAMDNGELVPYFQPIVELSTGWARGLEALIRWEHPVYGTVGPGRFLPAIEASGLMVPLGRQVLRQSLSLFSRLRGTWPDVDNLTVSVNVSLTQLHESGLAESVMRELAASDVPPSALTLELTETSDLLDDRGAVAELHAIHDSGVQLSLDDYGTGYSSLLRLLDLPVSIVKLDRSLVSRLPADPRAAAVTRSTLEMAAALGLKVVAEGVENVAQRDTLVDLGCDFAQGFLFSTAQPLGVIESVLARRGMRPPGRPRDDLTVRTAGSPAPHDLFTYDTNAAFAEAVADFVEPAARSAEGILLVLTPAHQKRVRAALVHRGLDMPALEASGRLVQRDATRVMADYLEGDDPGVAGIVGDLGLSLADLRARCGRVRIFGEMVSLLWEGGQVREALALEEAWNRELAGATDLRMLCSYPHHLVAGDSVEWAAVCAQHGLVLAH